MSKLPSVADCARVTDTIGIVSVLYNSEEVVDDFMASVARQKDVGLHLYVIDNSPTDGGLMRCRELARRYDINATFVANGENLGFAAGTNQGIRLALVDGCRWVLLANNDTDFAAGTLAALLGPLANGESVSTPKILYYGPERLIWYAGGRIDPWTMRVPHLGMRDADRGQHDKAGYTPFAPACFMLVESGVFRRLGLLDESYFVYYEDADFVWRLTRAELRIRYVPDAVVLHKVSALTGGKYSPFTLYFTNRNRIYFIRKNLRGLQRAVALSYVLMGRVVVASRLPIPLAKRLWAGVRDGLRLPISPASP